MFAPLPEPPYYAVIFSAQRTSADEPGYARTASHMEALARTHEGFIGIESTRDSEGFSITVSYWRSEDALIEWKRNSEHLLAQQFGRETWYQHYTLRVAKIERHYDKDSSHFTGADGQ